MPRKPNGTERMTSATRQKNQRARNADRLASLIAAHKLVIEAETIDEAHEISTSAVEAAG